ncbi:MAG: ABC transporter ATP-binding protein [Bacillota bacterium]|nr:ABC transporter ATP-binding protein [Bacillota bacterium]
MEHYFRTDDLAVGYDGNILIHDINVKLEKGKILSLIGPNGAGKSTILKSITRQLESIRGTVYINAQELSSCSPKDLARQVAVILTDRIRPELMSCAEVVATGRYPYTNLFGKLTAKDRAAVQEALERVHALSLAEQDFSTLSDGQRQRIMLARAICQEPEIIVLDEPTAYLDIRHKIELLDILREMTQKKNITVIMSLHEIDLAMKISDYLLCVKGDTIEAFGPPDLILGDQAIEQLYGLRKGSYNLLFGSVELTRPEGSPRLFVVAGNGYGIPCYRALQKQEIPFATGILFENDVDFQVAKELSSHVVLAPPFEAMTEAQFEEAAALMLQCEAVIDAGTPTGTFNQLNFKLLRLAEDHKIPVNGSKDWQEGQIWNT